MNKILEVKDNSIDSFMNSFSDFCEVALWTYTVEEDFFNGNDYINFKNAVYNARLIYTNEYYLKFKKLKNKDECIGKKLKELSVFSFEKIDKFLKQVYTNDFKVRNYIFEDNIKGNLTSIECNLICEFDEDNKLSKLFGSFVDRSEEYKSKNELDKLNKILLEQNNYFSKKLEELEKAKTLIDNEQEIYKGLFNESPAPKFIVHPINFSILQINKAALGLFDVKNQNELKLLDLIDSTNYEELADYLQNHNGSESTVFKGFTRSTQKELYLSIKSVRVKYEGSTALLLHISDLTEQIIFYEKELKLKEKINKMRDTLIDTQTSYKNFIDESPFAVVIVQDEEVKYINKVCMELLAAKHEDDLIGCNIYKFVHSDYHEFVNERFDKVLNERLHTETLREKLLRLNGEEFYGEIITFPTQYDGRDAVQLLFIDITDKIYQQQILVESEDRYRSIFESSFDAILITDFDGNIIDNNTSASTLFKSDKNNLISKNINEILVQDTYSFIEDPLKKIENEENFDGRCFAKDFEGNEFIAGINFKKIELKGESKIYISLRDITNEINAIDKINESRREAIDIIDNLTIPVSISDFETGKILYHSHKFKEIFGNEISNDTFTSFNLYKDINDAKHLRQLLKNNNKIKNFEVELYNKNKENIVVLMSSTRFKFREYDAILSIILDITERKKQEQELRNKDRLLEELCNTSKTGAWEYNLATNILTWSSETYKIHDIEQGSNIELSDMTKYYHPDDIDLFTEHFNNLLNYSVSYDLEVRLKANNQDYIWVRTIGQAIYEEGAVKRVSGTIQNINKTKHNELKLKEYSDTLSLATKAANFGIFDWNIKEKSLVWDDQMWELYELNKTEINDIHFWHEYLLKEDKIRLKQEMVNSFKNKKDFEYEYRLNLQNEKIKYIKSYAYVEFEENIAKRMVGVCWDITKEKLQEKQLQESLRKFENLYNNSPVMLHSIDKNGNILSTSNFWLKKLGYDRDFVIGKKSTFFLTPKSKKYAEDVILPKFFKDGVVNSVPYEVITKSNDILHVELSAISEEDVDGNFVRSLAVMVDVTEKIKAEKESEFKTNRLIEFRKALDASAFVVFTNLEGKIKYANGNFQDIVEMNAAKLHNKSIEFLIDKNASEFDINDYNESLANGKLWQGEIKLNNSKETWLKTTSIPLIDTTNDTTEVLIISFDITRIVEAEWNLKSLNKNLEERVKDRTRELINLNKEKDNILSMVSHDLKNPLTGIILAADIVKIQSETYKDDKLKEISNKISKTSYKMIDIIKNLLELNAVESGKIQTQFSYVDLTLILNNVVSDAQLNADKKNQIINLSNNFEQYPVYIDKKLIVQILDNLISNAIKFTHKNKNIYIELIDEENYYTIKIKDEGVGIPESDLPNMFQKFSKLSSKPTDGEDSTGLGLSIVKQLVEIMNGKIKVESELEIGTTFYIKFNRHQTNF